MKKSEISWLPLALVCLLCCATAGEAASSLVFPRVSSAPKTFTGLAIANLSDETATITLTAYGSDGTILSGPDFTNPATLSIPAHQQVARLVSEIFDGSFPSDTIAWIHLTSPTDELTGFFLFLNDSLTELDGADLPEADTEIIFNTVQVGNDFSTELNLVNTSFHDITATLTLVQPGDSAGIEQPLALPAKGVARIDAGTFFGVSSVPDGSYVRVATDSGSVAGLEFVRTTGGDLLGLNARKASEKLEHLFFPQMVASGPWRTQLGLVNYSDDPVLVTVYARQPDGTLYGGSELSSNPVSRGLGPRESLLLDIDELFGFTSEDAQEGWLEVEASEAAVNGFLSYGIPDVGTLAAIAASPESRVTSVFSHMASTGGFFTGLALLNPSSLTSNVRILAFSPEGELLGRDDTVIRPKQRLSRLVTEFVPGTENRSNGFIWIRSDVPLYTSVLFGAQKVLANVPPQGPPPDYAPDKNLDRLNVDPLLAVVQPGKTQQFTATQTPDPMTWSVNGVTSGDSKVGTIDSTGLYTAPSNKPTPSVITVSAEAGTLSGGASVDILTSEALVSGLGVLQSVVYMQSLQKLYEVELTSLGTLGSGISTASQTAANNQSELFQVQPPNVKTSVQRYSDDIVKLISYPASNGKEYMLLLGRTSGQLIRLEPLSGQSRIVYTGLSQPTSMALDAGTGSVLVAESDRITQVARSFIESGLSSATAADGKTTPGSPTSLSTLALITGASGLAVDRCTGEIYFSVESEGVIKAYDPVTGAVRTLVSGLSSPGQLLALYRDGVPCPERTQLLVAETGADRITLVAPSLGSIVSWISVPGVRDLTFIPPDNPFNLNTSVAYGLFFDQAGNISIVDVGDQYDTEPPVPEQPVCQAEATFDDAGLEAAVREALDLGPDEPITCVAAESLTELNAAGRNIRRIGGLEFLVNLEVVDLSRNFIKSLAPAGALTKLRVLDASYNLITSPGLSANLNQLSTLNLSYNLIEDLSTLIDLNIGSPGSPARVRARRIQALPSLSELDLSFNAFSDLTPLSSLTSLTALNLSGNFVIDDLSPLIPLVALRQLRLQWNLIRDLTSLSTLEVLQLLDLRHNRIAHLSPLLDNAGLGEGDQILLANNPLDLSDCAAFETLKQRGIDFDIDPPCDVDMAVSLSSPRSEVRFGDLILLQARVSNLGTSDGSDVSLHVQLDPSLTLHSVVGGDATCTSGSGIVDCRWTQLAHTAAPLIRIGALVRKSSGTLTSTAGVSARQSELNTDNNHDSLTIPLATVDLQVTKSATPSPAYVNGNLTYSIDVANRGGSSATTVEVTDPLPSGFSVETVSTSAGSCTLDEEHHLLQCQIASLSPESSAVISVGGTVTSEPGELLNTATVSSLENDSEPANNTGAVTTSVVQPDLAVTKTGSANPAITGTALTYTVSIVNHGTGAATNVTIADVLPQELQFDGFSLPGGNCGFADGQLNCLLPSLEAGATAVLQINATVIGVTASIVNTVSVAEDQTDANPDDNSATLSTLLVQRADLSVTKSALPLVIRPDDNVTYTIDVSNQGPSPATSVSLTDVLPADLDFSSVTPSHGNCAENPPFSGQIDCALGTLASGASASVQIVASYGGESNGTIFTNQVSVSAAETDPDLSNNSFTLDTPLATADLQVTLSDSPDPVSSGNTVTLTAQITNLGPDTATSVSTYTFPVFGDYTVTMVSSIPSQGSCSPVNPLSNSVSCTLGALAPGASATVTVTASAPFTQVPGVSVTNTVSVYSAERDPDGTNSSASETTTVNP